MIAVDGREIVYLGIPYSHKDAEVRRKRFEISCLVASILMKNDVVVYAPITHCYPIAVKQGLPHGWDFWEKFDTAYLRCSKALYVVTMEGWESSKGLNAEIQIAENLGIPVFYLSLYEKVNIKVEEYMNTGVEVAEFAETPKETTVLDPPRLPFFLMPQYREAGCLDVVNVYNRVDGDLEMVYQFAAPPTTQVEFEVINHRTYGVLVKYKDQIIYVSYRDCSSLRDIEEGGIYDGSMNEDFFVRMGER